MHKLAIKLFAATDDFAPTEFIPIFHRWIQTQALADHLLIDVADYAHVPSGPGTLLVAAEANIHMDRGDNRLGLMYVRKLPIKGATNFRETLASVVQHTLAAADLMQKEPAIGGRLKFGTGSVSIRFNDRLNTPNTPETFDAVSADVAHVATEIFGNSAAIDRVVGSAGQLMEIRITAAQLPI